MNVAEATRFAQIHIRAVAGEEDLQQAKELVGFVLGIEPAALMLHHGVEMTRDQLILLGEYLDRRAGGEPLQYILGQWSFMSLPMIVEPGILIPRQDTEVLCEKAEQLAKERGYTTVLDLCCGSGCIGIALHIRAGLRVTASDISGECTRIAVENAKLNGADLDIRTGDLFLAVAGETFDCIVCNPPYLNQTELSTMQKEVSFEPKIALDGGSDGLDFYRRISREYLEHLNPGGVLLMEIGATQSNAVLALFANASVLKDYAGNPRVVIVEGT
ncbi:MAG: peptide chain release factor N(5)-glutamine methyltransferase [Clostridia bacterium]